MIDQQTDRSKTKLYSILGDLNNQDLKTTLKGLSFDPASLNGAKSSDYALPGEKMFPINTKENAMLSRVYLDAQADALPDEARASATKGINRNLALFGVPTDKFTYKETTASSEASAEKTCPDRFLLPEYEFCKVGSERELLNAEKVFDKAYGPLKLADRVCFAKNFVKAASELKQQVSSEHIKKYAGLMDSDTVNVQCMLNMRAALARRKGSDGASYTKLAESLDLAELPPSRTELAKLAELISELDEASGITEKDYERRIPCPYQTVFSKEAADASSGADKDSAESLSKAEIVARYGEEALDAVEGDDGKIDVEKLKKIEELKKTHADGK